MIVCSAALLPNMVYAKEIKNTAAAKKLATEKIASATITEVDTDYENNGLVYEVNLYKGKREYQLTYQASNSKLIKYEWELFGNKTASASKQNLTKKQIKALAKKKVTGASIKNVRLDYDDGVPEYKVTLTKGKKRYKLIYHAQTGKLLEYEWELATNVDSSSEYIGTAKAKEIALEKVPGATIIKSEFDHDDGTPVYELELIKDQTEYEITIHAKTGKILEYDYEAAD